MGRAPCCEKVGLNRGPWTTEEDRILIDYINKNGHGNWRKLPQKAGLFRCGKSCRLRWINYLRPDLKRGNFSEEEEDTLIKLHQELGNKWSAIAKLMPGRTDNEIKNLWNTHLKKKLDHNISSETKKRPRKRSKIEKVVNKNTENPILNAQDSSIEKSTNHDITTSDENSSSVSMASNQNDGIADSLTKFFDIEVDFSWTDVTSADLITNDIITSFNGNLVDDDMEFWYNIYTRDGSIEDSLQDYP